MNEPASSLTVFTCILLHPDDRLELHQAVAPSEEALAPLLQRLFPPPLQLVLHRSGPARPGLPPGLYRSTPAPEHLLVPA